MKGSVLRNENGKNCPILDGISNFVVRGCLRPRRWQNVRIVRATASHILNHIPITLPSDELLVMRTPSAWGRGPKEYEDGHGHINYADIDGNGVYDSSLTTVCTLGDTGLQKGYARVVNSEEFVDCGNRVWTDCNGSGGNSGLAAAIAAAMRRQ